MVVKHYLLFVCKNTNFKCFKTRCIKKYSDLWTIRQACNLGLLHNTGIWLQVTLYALLSDAIKKGTKGSAINLNEETRNAH
jgi:hypothetical protein